MRRPTGESLQDLLPSQRRQQADASPVTAILRRLTAAVAITVPLLTVLASPAAAQLPDPSYWRSRVFFIPYQSAEPLRLGSAVDKVQLLVTRGDGQWAVLQEAEPNVRGFSYHAPVDGEYAFAVRTIDRRGEASPPTITHPQIRVVVDTAPPNVYLTASPDANGRVILRYDARDQAIKPETVRLEAQVAGGPWQRIATGPPDISQPDRVVGQVAWKPPTAANGVRFRATVDDRAGNQFSAVADASLVNPLTPTLAAAGPILSQPPSPGGYPATTPALNGPMLATPNGSEWSPQTPAVDPFAATATAAAPQEWSTAQSTPTLPAVASATASPFAAIDAAATQTPVEPLWPEAKTPARMVVDNGATTPPSWQSSDPFAAPPLVGSPSPFATASTGFQPPGPVPAASIDQQSIPSPPNWAAPVSQGAPHQAGGSQSQLQQTPPDADGTRWVNSLTFDVDYDLQTVGPWGVAKVELFATRDGGGSWANFGADADNRSPMRVQVPAAGLYGFRLVVNGANGSPAPTPAAGDKPELIIGVDLSEPTAELQAAEIGQGNLADHLIIRWNATDEHLDDRPVGLFYGTSPEGPWTTVATNVDNNGQYAWRLLQQIPERLYLRLEVRDKAGNVAVRQSPAPVVLNLPQPTGSLRSVRPVPSEPQRFRTATGQEIRSQ